MNTAILAVLALALANHDRFVAGTAIETEASMAAVERVTRRMTLTGCDPRMVTIAPSSLDTREQTDCATHEQSLSRSDGRQARPPRQPAGNRVVIKVLGQTISAVNPSGYCTPGESAPEVAWRKVLQAGQRDVVHVAALCAELAALESGTGLAPAHVILISAGNERFDVSREQFLVKTSRALQDMGRLNAQAGLILSKDQLTRRLMKATMGEGPVDSVLGRDQRAMYDIVRHARTVGDNASQSSLLNAHTLVRPVPLTVSVMKADSAPENFSQSLSTAIELVDSLVATNGATTASVAQGRPSGSSAAPTFVMSDEQVGIALEFQNYAASKGGVLAERDLTTPVYLALQAKVYKTLTPSQKNVLRQLGAGSCGWRRAADRGDFASMNRLVRAHEANVARVLGRDGELYVRIPGASDKTPINIFLRSWAHLAPEADLPKC
jgi:hypothetical protein